MFGIIGDLTKAVVGAVVETPIPSGPQPCPHCGVKFLKAWAEMVYGEERFFLEHGDPVCRLGAKRQEVFVLTEREMRAFRLWTPNAIITGRGDANEI